MAIDVPLVAAFAAMPAIVLAAYLPSQLVLPAIAVLAFALAAATTAFGLLMGAQRDGNTVTIFDFSGACVLIGSAAGVFSEPNQVLQFFGAAMTAL